jgi:hypothetical protein
MVARFDGRAVLLTGALSSVGAATKRPPFTRYIGSESGEE